MPCFYCSAKLEKTITELSAVVKGLKVAVRDFECLLCPRCGYKTIEGKMMPEYMRKAKKEYDRHQSS